MTMTPPKLLSIKLKSGETIFAEELNEDEVSIEILNPLLVVLVPQRDNDGSFTEYLSTKPWHPFTSDKYFLIYKSDMIHYGPLKEYYRTYYLKMLISEAADVVNEEINEKAEELNQTEEESLEEFQNKLDMLAERLGIENPDAEESDDVIETKMFSSDSISIVFDTHKTLQ